MELFRQHDLVQNGFFRIILRKFTNFKKITKILKHMLKLNLKVVDNCTK